MALYWHPFLADGLRLSYGGRLDVQENVLLGDLPLAADVLIRRNPNVSLPFPLGFLGPTTLVELKSPNDVVDQAALEQILIYALLYVRRERLSRRQDLTLWLMGSNFTSTLSQVDKCEIRDRESVGPGVERGTLDKFSIFLVDLPSVPFTPDTIALHMVSGPPRDRELAAFLVEHHREYRRQLEQMGHLHLVALGEVLMLYNLTPEQLGWTPEAAAKFLALFRSSSRPLQPIHSEVLVEEVIQRPEVHAALVDKLAQGPNKEVLIDMLTQGPNKEVLIDMLTQGPNKEALIDKLLHLLGPEELKRRLEALAPSTPVTNDAPPAYSDPSP